jgi:hypothetical protein
MDYQLARRAIIWPLIGIAFAWLTFMAANYSQFFIQPELDKFGNYLYEPDVVRASTYLFLLGIAAFAFTALTALNLAVRARELNGAAAGLARSAFRFANLSVILSLAAGAVYAIGNFMAAFNGSDLSRQNNLLVRAFGVYVPIILATGVVVFVLLRAFVFRRDQVEESHDNGKARISERQKAIGLGYASPIIGTAVAIVFGLGVYDATRTSLDVWIWVIITLIVASSILIGTNFASKAKSARQVAPRPRNFAAGAANLNFVLSIVFVVVVGSMAFGFGFAATEGLRTWNSNEPGWTIAPIGIQWLLEKFAPAVVLLAVAEAAIYFSLIARNRKEQPAETIESAHAG